MQSEKKIAKIYYEAKIFLTIYGTYYSYDFENNHAVCRRLDDGQQELLARIYGIPKNEELSSWQPVAQHPQKLNLIYNNNYRASQ